MAVALLIISVFHLAFNIQLTKTELVASDLPVNIHLTWQQSDTAHTITATWQTNSPDSGDTVLYDTIPRNGNPELYRYSAVGTHHSYPDASGYIHEVDLEGLTPDTAYHFVCGGDAGGWSSERAFRTAPSVSHDVRFVVGGDSRTNWDERTKISMAMAEFNPAFAIHSGDMVVDGTIQSQWDSWFTDVHENWIGENNLTIPVIPVLGNHENPNDPDTKYFSQFALPDNERWYSYDWGSDIHIICLDSESSPSGEQLSWLENDLAAHSHYTWKFVIFHMPPFVSGSHDPWEPAVTYWVPLFDKYHVDMVFNGHEHNYQRTCPLNWTASQTEPQDYSNGTTYIVSGGWGAPLYTPSPIWYMDYQKAAYHFVLIDVFVNGTLHMQAKDNDGVTFDEVWIYRRACLAVRGMDNQIYYRLYAPDSTYWSSWSVAPTGATCDSPAAVVYNGELHLVVRGADGNTLWHGYVSLMNAVFAGWTLLSGSSPSAPTLTSNGTHLCLVVQGNNNRIYYRVYGFAPRGWSGWNALTTGSTAYSPSAAMLGGNLHIVVRSMDGSCLWNIVVKPAGSVIRNWISLSSSTPMRPALAADPAANKLYLAVRGGGSQVYWRSYDATADTWAAWNKVPTGTTSDAPAATAVDNKLHIVVRGMSGITLWHGNVDLTSNAFSGWTLLSGSTSSAPTLTS
jgi:hypothetical protein